MILNIYMVYMYILEDTKQNEQNHFKNQPLHAIRNMLFSSNN